MTVNELIELLSTQPGDYEVAVRTIDNDNLSIWEDAITGLAEVETPDDGMPGYVILNYEGNETGEPPGDDNEPEMTEHQREPGQEDDNNSLIEGPDGREWSWEQFQSWVISLSIRNALEMFHGGGAMDPENPDSEEGFITDRQMKALNIVIRHTVSEMVKKLSNPAKTEKNSTGRLRMSTSIWSHLAQMSWRERTRISKRVVSIPPALFQTAPEASLREEDGSTDRGRHRE